MKYYILSPEVAGHLANGTITDPTIRPPGIKFFHYEFDGWQGDDIMTSLGYFIATDKLRSKIEDSTLSGYEFDEVKLSHSREYKLSLARRPRPTPPVCYWLKINGVLGRDDFGIYEDTTLVVSEKALTILKSINIQHCDVEEFLTKC